MVFFFFQTINLYQTMFFFSSRRRHTRSTRDWSSDVCSSDLLAVEDAHHRVVLQEIGKVCIVEEIVHRDDVDVVAVRKDAEHGATDPAESVDADRDGHRGAAAFRSSSVKRSISS